MVSNMHKNISDLFSMGWMSKGNGAIVVVGVNTFTMVHLAQILLKRHQLVRGTVEPGSLKKNHMILSDLTDFERSRLTVFQVDHLLEDCKWDPILEGASLVIYAVNPLPPEGGKQTKALSPTIDEACVHRHVTACKNMLSACAKAKTVRKIILLTSVATVAWRHEMSNNREPHTEETYEVVGNLTGFAKCHILAEKAAWAFINSLTESDKIDLVVLNPSFTIGPMIDGIWSYPLDMIRQLIGVTGRDRLRLPSAYLSYVDVRDVAQAIIAAMSEPRAVGQRHILHACGNWLQNISDMLAKEFSAEGYYFGEATQKSCCARFCCGNSKPAMQLGEIYDSLEGQAFRYDNTRMVEILGVTPRAMEETVVETAYSIIFYDYLSIKKRKRSSIKVIR